MFSPVSSSIRDDCTGEEDLVVSDLTKDARAKINVLVERAERQTGSRMAAYELVAQMVGRSPEWLRAFARGYPHAKVDCTILNISEAYRRAGQIDGEAR
jgi:hypothetical protein